MKDAIYARVSDGLLKPEDSELSAIEILEECAWEVHHSVWEDDRLRCKAERKLNRAIDYLKQS